MRLFCRAVCAIDRSGKVLTALDLLSRYFFPAAGILLLGAGICFRVFRRMKAPLPTRFAADLTPLVLCAFVTVCGTVSCSDSRHGTHSSVFDPSLTDIVQSMAEPYDPLPGNGTEETIPAEEARMLYFHPDHAGSVKYATKGSTDSTNGTVVYQTAYKPYGGHVAIATSGSDTFNRKYTGQQEDSTGLLYYQSRFYDPVIGRFLSADTVVPNPAMSQAFNRYMYVMGNPVKYSDPDGHFGIGTLIGAIVGAAVGFVTGGTHGQPWKLNRWRHFDFKKATLGACIGAATGALIGSGIGYMAAGGGQAAVDAGYTAESIKSLAMAGASGSLSGYSQYQRGGDEYDVAFAFCTAYAFSLWMANNTSYIVGPNSIYDTIIRGGASSLVTNILSQGEMKARYRNYNFSVSDCFGSTICGMAGAGVGILFNRLLKNSLRY